jgi:nucleoside-diphosphate-sugar epimerase
MPASGQKLPRQLMAVVSPLFGVAWRIAALMEVVWRTFRVGKKPPITRQTLRMIGQVFTVDITEARRDLGYRPVTNWADGIARMRG